MFRLSKKVEYGILAMQYLAENQDEVITTKEIAKKLDISFEFLAKTLQLLKKRDLVSTIQGMRGGYKLNTPADQITLFTILKALDSKPEIVECADDEDHESCERKEYCSIRNPLMILQDKIVDVVKNIKLSEMLTNDDKLNNQNTVELALNYSKG